MSPLERVLIEKAGYQHGWENVIQSTDELVLMRSARHTAEAHVGAGPMPECWLVSFPLGPSIPELLRTFPEAHDSGSTFTIRGEAGLGQLLRRAAELAMSLPDNAATQYAAAVSGIGQAGSFETEAIRMVKQRIGQDIFRAALLDYWGGGCAVTGIAVSELLRASHAVPWAKCGSDQERLNVFNGLLLCAHLDALFDRGLLWFDDAGIGKVSQLVGDDTLAALGLSRELALRWIAPEHRPFLAWHRERIAVAA